MRSRGITTSAKLPKPVLTPYTTSPRATAASTTPRARATDSRAAADNPTRLPPWDTASSAASVRLEPSSRRASASGEAIAAEAAPTIARASRARRARGFLAAPRVRG